MIVTRIRPYFIFLLSAFLLSSFSEDMQFRKIDMKSGLSYNSVLCVAEDHEEIIWIGTREGLNRYNSIDNVIYKHDFEDSTSISNNHINCIFKSPTSNVLWIGTADGLNRYNRLKDNFKQYLFSPDSAGLSNVYVRCITEGSNNKLYIGTSNGLNIYIPNTDSFRQILLEDPPTLSNNIISIFYDINIGIWLGTKGGLYLWANNKLLPVRFDSLAKSELSNIEIRDIKKDKDGTYWIATEKNGLYSFTFSEGIVQRLNHLFTGNSNIYSDHIRNILVDNDSLWLGTLDGLCILNKKSSHITNIIYSTANPDGISNSSVHDILKDHAGGYWLATYTGGVNYYHPQNNLFPHFKRILGEKNSINSDVISCFYTDKQGDLWLGTGNGGLNLVDRKRNEITIYKTGGLNTISDDNIKDLFPDADGNLWIGTHEGLNFFNRKTNTFNRFFHDPNNANSLNQNQVETIWVAEEGLVWIGMNVGILQVYDPKEKKFTSYPEVGNIVTKIFEDHLGHLWIAERSGLKCFDRKSRKLIDISEYTAGIQMQFKYVNWIGDDSKGRMWIGTESSGLYIFKSGKTYHFNKNNGLLDNTVNAILEDNSGDYWISTSKGISKIKYSENDQGIPQLLSINFTTIHGLQGNQFDPGSAYKTSSGKLYFGGTNGYNAFSPEDIKKQDFFPPVIFSGFQINFVTQSPDLKGSPLKMAINESKEISLKYRERNISFKFAGINFVNPDETFYRYQLTDLNDDWIDLGNQRTLNFTYLPVGEHELKIKASTNPLIWGENYKSLVLIVLPPWWLTVWAYVIYVFIFFILMYSFFAYSQRWANLKNKLKMEHFQREKEHELHESKLTFFTDVSHELRTPLTLIMAPLEKIMMETNFSEKVNSQLQLIQRNGNRMMQLIDQVLNLRKLETGHEKLQSAKGNIVTFLKEISLAFAEIATSKNIQFEYLPTVEKLGLWYDRDKMEIIIYNLLSNAFKNTHKGGRITMHLSIIESDIAENAIFKGTTNKIQFAEIYVEDTGRGISASNLTQIFNRFYTAIEKENESIKGTGVGLELTKRMVELHKGQIKVESRLATSEQSGFTRFTVSLPIGKKHLTQEERVVDFKNSEDPSRYTHELKFREKLGNLVPDPLGIELPKLSDKDKQTLLIVEDNLEVRAFVRDLFRENYLIDEAADGMQGWKLAIEIVPDLVISDIMMPEMDGIQLCRKLKTDVRTSHIPVILLTARTTLAIKYEGLETGADEYITKPFSAQFLILKVKNLIRQRELLRQHFEMESITMPKILTITSVDERLLNKAMEYISKHMEDPSISVEILSQELGLSRVHFYRKIKSLTNLTAVEFIRNIRLKRAANLLEQGKLSVKEVQHMTGFDSADYFRKCFKEQYGYPPSEYAMRKKS